MVVLRYEASGFPSLGNTALACCVLLALPVADPLSVYSLGLVSCHLILRLFGDDTVRRLGLGPELLRLVCSCRRRGAS